MPMFRIVSGYIAERDEKKTNKTRFDFTDLNFLKDEQPATLNEAGQRTRVRRMK